MLKWAESLGRMTGTQYRAYVLDAVRADRAWQAAFDNVLAMDGGVDEELITIVDQLRRHAEDSVGFLYAHGWRWDENGELIR